MITCRQSRGFGSVMEERHMNMHLLRTLMLSTSIVPKQCKHINRHHHVLILTATSSKLFRLEKENSYSPTLHLIRELQAILLFGRFQHSIVQCGKTFLLSEVDACTLQRRWCTSHCLHKWIPSSFVPSVYDSLWFLERGAV